MAGGAIRVAIVGGGIAGLTLAAALRRMVPSASVHVFERDASRDARPQGYSLSLNGAMGLRALKEIGVSEEQIGKSCNTTKAFHIASASGWTLMTLDGSKGKKPYHKDHHTVRFDRPVLHDLLLESAQQQLDGAQPLTTHWDKQVEGVTNNDTSASVLFKDGSSFEADVIIGADGSRSTLRDLFVGEDNQTLDVTMMTGRVPLSAVPSLNSGNVGAESSLFVLGDNGDSFFASPGANGTDVGWSYSAHTEGAAGRRIISAETEMSLKAAVCSGVSSWRHDDVKAIVEATPAPVLNTRFLTDRKFPKTAAYKRVAIIGDAAHPMTPFRGLGANTAMVDAVSLAKMLRAATENGEDVMGALRQFNEEMLPRAKQAVDASREACMLYHTMDPRTRGNRNRKLWLIGRGIALARLFS